MVSDFFYDCGLSFPLFLMASSSSFSVNPYLINITDYVSENLNMNNYLTWSYLFKHVLDIYDLSDHVKPSSTISPKTLQVADEKSSSENPEYPSWHKIDGLILTWINATLKKEVIPLIYHSTIASKHGMRSNLIFLTSQLLENSLSNFLLTN